MEAEGERERGKERGELVREYGRDREERKGELCHKSQFRPGSKGRKQGDESGKVDLDPRIRLFCVVFCIHL